MINESDYNTITSLLQSESGICLDDNKDYLLESRLLPIIKQHSLDGFSGLASAVLSNNKVVCDAVIEAMTTNETFFFRNPSVFRYFADKFIPHVASTTSETAMIHIWCAACSYGQEPYSLAALIEENRAILGKRQVKILGTDISGEAIERAVKGIYSDFEIQRGLPSHIRTRYFRKTFPLGYWEVDSSLRKLVSFKKHNLLHTLGTGIYYHAVFMRNVLIYFDQETKNNILQRTHPLLDKDGFLFLSGIETVSGLHHLYDTVPNVRGVFRVK